MITVLVVEIGWAAHQLQVERWSQVQSSTCHFLRPLMMTYWLLWSSSDVALIQSAEGNI